jgi:NADH-quinone oxidoreductase subunit K
MVPVGYYVVLSAALFTVGLVGILVRRNVLVILMAVELMINAVNLNFVAFSNLHANYTGIVFVLFVIGVEAAELAIALTVILAYYRHRETLDGDAMNLLKG